MKNMTNRLFAVLFGCTLLGSGLARAESGVVVDRQGTPTPGVFIISTWQGSAPAPGQSGLVCYKAEFAMTDEQGRFSISEFSGNLNPFLVGRHRSLMVYRPGYRTAENWSAHPDKITLYVDERGPSERYRALPNYPMARCETDQRRFLPYLRAVAEEANSLASSPEEKRDSLERLYIADEVEFGSDEAHRRLAKRRAQMQRGAQ